jgi:TPR repeat protein
VNINGKAKAAAVSPVLFAEPRYLLQKNASLLEKRVAANDSENMYQLGRKYLNGDHELDIKKDEVNAFKLFHAQAYFNLGFMYDKGVGLSKDGTKARQYHELAAIKGCTVSRLSLGAFEVAAGNADRAIKHCLIAAEFGVVEAVDFIRNSLISGHATKDQYVQALRLYQAYLDEVKSDQRDKAAAHSDRSI